MELIDRRDPPVRHVTPAAVAAALALTLWATPAARADERALAIGMGVAVVTNLGFMTYDLAQAGRGRGASVGVAIAEIAVAAPQLAYLVHRYAEDAEPLALVGAFATGLLVGHGATSLVIHAVAADDARVVVGWHGRF